MVLDATDRFGHAAHATHRSTDIFVEARSPLGPNQRTPFLRTEDDVVVDTVECRTHGLPHLLSGTPAGVRGINSNADRRSARCSDLRLLSGNPSGCLQRKMSNLLFLVAARRTLSRAGGRDILLLAKAPRSGYKRRP